MPPKQIMVDLDDLRGYGVTPIRFRIERNGNRYVASYCHDGSQYGIAVYWADTKDDALKQMEDFCKRNDLREGKIYSCEDISHMV